jgi:hypothetical protein
MNGLIITVTQAGSGWQVTVWEGCFTVYEADGLTTAVAALEAGQAWVATHRPGEPCLVEVAPDPVTP